MYYSFCICDKEKAQGLYRENENLMRKTIKKSSNSEMNAGIHFQFILKDRNTTNFYDILTVDIMHDLLEGITHYEMKSFLNFLLKNVMMLINQRIILFDY